MSKIGIFGGSFNPPHLGHVNVATTVQKKLGLDKIYVIPAAQNPLKHPIEGATPEQRLEMTRLAFSTYGEKFIVDDCEIKRGGKSYTIDTVKMFQEQCPNDELFLILGFDAFEEFGSWKDAAKILDITNLIVVSRPGGDFPDRKEELPSFVLPLIDQFEFNVVELKSKKKHTIYISKGY